MTSEIDLIVTWVNGEDEAWRKQRKQYENKAGAVQDWFFRDWKLMRYWFRGVEKNLSWIRKIHFVTWGHVPAWLNVEHPKIHIVNHKDFIPGEYLPVFSSHPIELNFHRIEGLSEKFIYTNDDIFFTGEVPKEYYFQKGRPCDFIMLYPITEMCRDGFGHILWNNIACINRNFKLRECMEQNKEKWFHPAYSENILQKNRIGYQLQNFPGFRGFHMPLAYRKNTFKEVWKKERNLLHQTCLQRFRSAGDVSGWLMRYWRLAQGDFWPRMEENSVYVSMDQPLEMLRNTVLSAENHIICLNEGIGEIDFEWRSSYVRSLFDMVLPEMCSFERF